MKLLCGTLPQRLVHVLTPEGHIMKPDGVSIWNHILWCHCYQWAVLCCSAAVKERVKSTPKLHLFLQISANVRLGKLMFVFHNYQDTIREVPSLEIFSRRHSQRSVLRLLQSKKVRYFYVVHNILCPNCLFHSKWSLWVPEHPCMVTYFFTTIFSFWSHLVEGCLHSSV